MRLKRTTLSRLETVDRNDKNWLYRPTRDLDPSEGDRLMDSDLKSKEGCQADDSAEWCKHMNATCFLPCTLYIHGIWIHGTVNHGNATEALGWFTTGKLNPENRQRIKILGARCNLHILIMTSPFTCVTPLHL